MRIFALETNREKAKAEIFLKDEKEVRSVCYHGFIFFLGSIGGFLAMITIFTIYGSLIFFGVPHMFNPIVLFVVFLLLLFFSVLPIMRAWIDWKYDGIIITDKRVLVLDQTSIFHENNRKMDLENVASVASKSQFWNIFSFGILKLDLKEGVGKSIILKYIPNSPQVSKCISQCLIDCQAKRHHT